MMRRVPVYRDGPNGEPEQIGWEYSFTTDDIQPGDELVTDFEKVDGRYWQRTIKLIRNGRIVGINTTHGVTIDPKERDLGKADG